MLWHKTIGAAGFSKPPVDYSGLTGFVSSGGTFTIPALASNQMVVLTERANSATPPATRAGFTSIVTSSNGAVNRSFRSSYRIGGSAQTITFSQTASYVILNNASTIGQTATYSTSSFNTNVPIPAISSLDTSGNSLIWATTYNPSLNTSITSPYTLSSQIGGYIEGNTSSSLAQGTITSSTNLYHISAVMEIKP